MKALILLFMLVSLQAFTQAIIIHQKINIVQLMTVLESKDAKGIIMYKFINTRLVEPIKVNDSTWKINVPMNEFTMALIDEKEWIGIKPNNQKYEAIIPFEFDDGLMTVVEFNTKTKKYKDNFYGDLIYYKP